WRGGGRFGHEVLQIDYLAPAPPGAGGTEGTDKKGDLSLRRQLRQFPPIFCGFCTYILSWAKARPTFTRCFLPATVLTSSPNPFSVSIMLKVRFERISSPLSKAQLR